jgi:5'-3' exonuclease
MSKRGMFWVFTMIIVLVILILLLVIGKVYIGTVLEQKSARITSSTAEMSQNDICRALLSTPIPNEKTLAEKVITARSDNSFDDIQDDIEFFIEERIGKKAEFTLYINDKDVLNNHWIGFLDSMECKATLYDYQRSEPFELRLEIDRNIIEESK